MNATQRAKSKARARAFMRDMGETPLSKFRAKNPGKASFRASRNFRYRCGMNINEAPWHSGPTWVLKTRCQ